MTLPELDNLQDGYWWGRTKPTARGVFAWRMLRKSTDRQSWGMPWKDVDGNARQSWAQIRDRYAEIVEVKHP